MTTAAASLILHMAAYCIPLAKLGCEGFTLALAKGAKAV